MSVKQVGKSEIFNRTESQLRWGIKGDQRADLSGNPILSRYDLLNKVLKSPIPIGFSLGTLLKLFAERYPELVAVHEKTGAIHLRKNNVPLFEEFVKEYADKVYKNEKENYITVDEILRKYRFLKRPTKQFLEKQISKFSQQNADAVTKVANKIIRGNHIKTVRVLAINKSALPDFFNFAGLIINKKPLPTKPKQQKISPDIPGYEQDPTLASVPDAVMDAVAYKLAAKKLSDKDDADTALLLELQKIAAQRGGK